MTPNTIPAKLLLFGEYTVLHGGRALAVPETRWSGQLGMSGDGKRSDELQTWADDIASRMLWPKATMDQFRRDIDAGLSFASNIPLGYGLGSSGALCAAVYKTYRNTGDSIEVYAKGAGRNGKLFSWDEFRNGPTGLTVAYTDFKGR